MKMNALIIKFTQINPFTIKDEEEFAQVWACTKWLIEQQNK